MSLGYILQFQLYSRHTKGREIYTKFLQILGCLHSELCSVLRAVSQRVLGADIVAGALFEVVHGVQFGVGDQVMKIAVVGAIIKHSIPSI